MPVGLPLRLGEGLFDAEDDIVLVELDLRWSDVEDWDLARISRSESAAPCCGLSLKVGKRIIWVCGVECVEEGCFDGIVVVAVR